jgi:D-xylose transport system ATP-binding protein
MNFLLEARRLTKSFPGVVALRDVSFDLRPGEIHALCGENGAGKSTLIKTLSGLHPFGNYEGEILVDGKRAEFRSLRDAEAAGLAVIYQELALVEEMSVAENIFLGAERRRGPWVDWDRAYADAASLLAKFRIELDPDTPVRQLGVGQKQLVEIVKALGKQSRILILDEPTAALAESEVTILLRILGELRAAGVACIYISHKLGEVKSIADRITVLRDGASITTLPAADADIPTIIRHMVGREIKDLFPRHSGSRKSETGSRNETETAQSSAAQPVESSSAGARFPLPGGEGQGEGGRHSLLHGEAEPLLAVRNLSVSPDADSAPRLRNLSFAVAAGEVLGIGGLMGAGRSELLQHLFGAWGVRQAGEVTLRGDNYVAPTPRESIRRGLVLVTEDRKRLGLHLEQPIGFNLSLSSLDRLNPGVFLDETAEAPANQRFFDALRIKAPGLETTVGGLSGGNQQKVVLGKALMTEPKVVFLDEPTRGIDVGAKLEVYHLINELTAQGKAVVLVSSELPELMGMSDRIVMLHEGRLGGEFTREQFDQEALMAAAMGNESTASR